MADTKVETLSRLAQWSIDNFGASTYKRSDPFKIVYERLLRTSEDFVWPIDSCLQGRFIIDVEFLDLKIYTPNMSFLTFCSVQVAEKENLYGLMT
ncbi:hypothetical protein K7X08_002532 [Anisodus acutangulus]|uniref:Uncharacterized protein n=1 Tax=Anisodus acutangulus TaxID=402998 RepID=A0A9Q1R7D2_9SOLA|nr:hypothetical protein K7X08_002532 [Anisodus acutangulus]